MTSSLEGYRAYSNQYYNAQPLDTEEQLLNTYGKWFCRTVGMEHLKKMPRVTAESLHLEDVGKYPRVAIELLGEHSAVKGMDGLGRPFIAIKIEDYNNNTNKMVKYVELIFKRYSNRYDGAQGKLHENNYVSSLTNPVSEDVYVDSVIYQTGFINDFSQMKKLLDGELVKTSLMNHRGGYIRKI